MTDFLRFIREVIEFIWPFKIVHEWEKGVMYAFGRYWRTVEPGCYLVCPFFMSLHEVSVVPGMIGTHRLDLTCLDGSTLTVQASMWHRVVDPATAVNTVEDFETTSASLLEAVLADKIAKVDASRLLPEARGRLLSDLTRWVAEEAAEYGIEVTKVRFSSFVHKARTYRLIGEH